MSSPLKSAEWLHQELANPNLIILDASQTSNAIEYAQQRIKGARFFDLKNTFSEVGATFPNTIPSEEKFQTGCQNLGINQTSTVVVYDNLGIYSSPRVWWLFKVMGFEAVFVLNGGLPEWVNKGFETEEITDLKIEKGNFQAHFNSAQVKDYHFILENLTQKQAIVVDARSAGRYNGTEPEPRIELKSGKIPNSFNIPYTAVLENGKLKSKAALITLFEELHTFKKTLVFSCGSGLTACIILLAYETVYGTGNTTVYDGSWTEWATLQGLTNSTT